MKGIVFNLLEELVSRDLGDAVWDQLLEDSGAGGVYTSLGSYPDEELISLVAAASKTLQKPPDAILQWFGNGAMPLLAAKYPAFFAPHEATRPFLLTLNDIIHPEVLKLYPGAVPPVFAFDSSSEDVLVMEYRSRRKLCALALGFIEGAAEHFGESVIAEQTTCTQRGAETCTFQLRFSPIAT